MSCWPASCSQDLSSHTEVGLLLLSGLLCNKPPAGARQQVLHRTSGHKGHHAELWRLLASAQMRQAAQVWLHWHCGWRGSPKLGVDSKVQLARAMMMQA